MMSNPTENKLYIVVRSDISPAQQAVQAIHAAATHAAIHTEVAEWPLALLSVPSLNALNKFDANLNYHARTLFCEASAFVEPDIGYEKTAIAGHGPAMAKATRDLPLALQYVI